MAEPLGPPAEGDGLLEELNEAACQKLLTRAVVGRLIWYGDEGLSATPVNYALDGRDIIVRLSPNSLVAREGDRSAVAFEVDEIDPEKRHGWSVLARGWARQEPRPPVRARVDVWPSGARPLCCASRSVA